MSVEVANESGIEVDEAELSSVARLALEPLGSTRWPSCRCSPSTLDHGRAARAVDGPAGPTDVLAFPMDEMDAARAGRVEPGPTLLGDVVLCPAFALATPATPATG